MTLTDEPPHTGRGKVLLGGRHAGAVTLTSCVHRVLQQGAGLGNITEGQACCLLTCDCELKLQMRVDTMPTMGLLMMRAILQKAALCHHHHRRAVVRNMSVGKGGVRYVNSVKKVLHPTRLHPLPSRQIAGAQESSSAGNSAKAPIWSEKLFRVQCEDCVLG